MSIPCLLSVLAYFNPQAYVTGINDFPGQPTPPIALLFQVYHLMFMLGSLFVPIGLLGGLFYFLKKGKKGDAERPRRIWDARWVLRLFVITVFLVEVAIIAGWWTAEIGRQPWVVYEVLLTADGVSPLLTATDVVLSLGIFIVLYALLLVLFLYLLNAKTRPGLSRSRRWRRSTCRASRTRSATCPPARSGGRGRRAVSLNEVWGVLFVFIIAGYLILDGFDMGVGILHVPLARTDVERRTFLNSIGPVWDGNEVWLVLGGGVLFAVFPLVYASLFSGFYLAFMLVLLVMILRTVSIEFGARRTRLAGDLPGTPSSGWPRSGWRSCSASRSATSSRACR